MLGSGDRVEIVANQLSNELGVYLAERGAYIERNPNAVKIVVPTAQKRELAETLWNAGSDVISINQVRSSLEELFLKLVGGGEPS